MITFLVWLGVVNAPIPFDPYSPLKCEPPAQTQDTE